MKNAGEVYPLGSIKVKGKEEHVEVYEVLGLVQPVRVGR